jgi:hypothetical protein
MPRKLIACAMAANMLVAGCLSNPHAHSGKLIAEYRPGEEPSTARTPYQATYALYQWRSPPTQPPPHTWIPEQEITELYVRGLSRWKTIGFTRESDGALYATAGEEKIPLAEGHYCWHITPQTETHGLERVLSETGENVVTIVSLPFGTACFLVVAPVFMVWTGLAMLSM